jgi:hypothetical protein
MNVKKMPNESTAHALATLLTNSLPLATQTGLVKKLRSIKTDPNSKGKAVQFTWNLTPFKVTENVGVYELDFMNNWQKSTDALELETILKNKNE